MNQEKTLYNLNLRLIDIGGYIKRTINYLFHHELYSLLQRNTELIKPENYSRKCYVLALGPSLKKIDFNKIEGDTIAVNRFYKIGESFPDFVPTYYIMLDHLFNKPENIADFESAISAYIDRGTKFILNSKLASLPLMQKYKDNKNIYYISTFKGTMHSEGNYRIDGILPAFQNVVGAAILFVSLMGYKRISLLGCDFNSFASKKMVHCYEDKSTDRIHRLSFELFCYYLAAKNHDDLHEYSKFRGFEIINATEGSLIDSYPFEIETNILKNSN